LARSVHREPVAGDPLLVVDDGIDAQRRLDHLVDAVGRLAPEDRDLLVMIAWESCSGAEAAEMLGIPAGTVRSRLNRIRSQLRSQERNFADG
jgi:RNA polymerase sigma-70 factor, ECF subfamily